MRRALIKRNAQFFDRFVDDVGIQNIQMMHKNHVHNTSSASPQHSTPPAAYRHGMPCCFLVYQLIQTFFLHGNLIPSNIFAGRHKFVPNIAPPFRSTYGNVLQACHHFLFWFNT
jgi:hypothetical protein